MDSTPAPPPPVLVTRTDLPKVAAVMLVGYAAVCWLALRLDESFAGGDERDDTFYYPCVFFPLSIRSWRLVADFGLGVKVCGVLPGGLHFAAGDFPTRGAR